MPEDNAATIEAIARKLHESEEPVDWSGFWQDVESLFGKDTKPLIQIYSAPTTLERKKMTNKAHNPFTRYDSSQMAGQTPLTKLLDQVLVEPYLREGSEKKTNNCDGVFIPLSFQTGIGKTYTALSCIMEEMLWQIQKNETRPDNTKSGQPNGAKRTIIYITNSVDNVRHAYDDLLDQIGSDVRFTTPQKKYLKEQVCYLPRQATHLREFSRRSKDINHILEPFKLQKDGNFSREITDLIKYLKTDPSDYSPLTDENIQRIYRRLIDKIQGIQRSPAPVTLNKEQTDALDMLMPGYRFERGASHVLFMTTKKYLYGFDHSTGKYIPLRNLPDQLLIIDEVDRQNEEILHHLVENRPRDLISTIKTLKTALSYNQIPTTPYYQGIDKLFDKIKMSFDALADTWHMDYSYNIDGDTLGDDPVHLFSDRAITHTPHTNYIRSKSEGDNLTHHLHLEFNNEIHQNIIKASERERYNPSEDIDGINDSSLTKFANEMDRCYQQFLTYMGYAAQQYVKNTEKLPVSRREDRSTTGALQEAVYTILGQCNLQEYTNDVLAALNAQRSTKKQSVNPANKSYHCNGLKHIDIHRNVPAVDIVNCEYSGFDRTPTGLLADIIESGAIVLGISATALANTVIHNFDMPYLKRRLGDRFLELTPEQRKSVYDYYVANRNYIAAGVTVETSYITTSDNLITSLIKKWKPNAANIDIVWANTCEGMGNNTTFHRTWVSKLLQAIQAFIATDDSRYMMGFCNRTISGEKDGTKKIVQYIEYCIQLWATEHNRTVRLFDGIDAKSMQPGKKYDELLQYLHQTKGKAIALTTYASMGIGKNPDYQVSQSSNEWDLLHYVGPKGRKPPRNDLRTDIDTLYLEKPTQMLLSGNTTETREDKMVLFHQILSLQESGDISPKEAIHWIRKGLTNTNRRGDLTEYHKTADYCYALRRRIEQAVGRSARTPFKRTFIRLFADSDLKPFFSDDDRDHTLLSHEYESLRQEAKRGQPGKAENTRERRRQYNRASRNNLASKHIINSLLRRIGNRTEIDQNAIATWAALRDQVMQFPTLPAEPDESNTWSRAYLQSPTDGEYRYDGNSDENLYEYKFFDDAQTSKHRVSNQDSDLPDVIKCPIVRRHFESAGYALEWPQHSWLLTPIMYTDIYRPAIAEQACKAILVANDIRWDEMPDEKYEMFDAIIQHADAPEAYLDVKNWRMTRQADANMIKKAESVAPKRLVYLNLFGPPAGGWRHLDRKFREVRTAQNADILEVSGLLNRNDSTILENNLQYLRQWLLWTPPTTSKTQE